MSFSSIPTICVANAVDTLRTLVDCLSDKTCSEELISKAHAQQDQSLFWLPAKKLIIAECPIHGLGFFKEITGIDVNVICPENNFEDSFMKNVIQDKKIISDISTYIGNSDTVRIYSHTYTSQIMEFANNISKALNINVLMPEAPKNIAIRDHLDTKKGFRLFCSKLGLDSGPCRVPEGNYFSSITEAAKYSFSLLNAGKTVIFKPNSGEASLGLKIFRPGETLEKIIQTLNLSKFYGNDFIIVEEFIGSNVIDFPSIEINIPPEGAPPEVMHVCSMLFKEKTVLVGNVTHIELYSEKWCSHFINSAITIALAMQSLGYIGHFGIDAVAISTGEVFMLDLNSRRTGSTHVHEFAVHLWGDNYIEHVCIGNYDFDGLPKNFSLEDLRLLLGDLIQNPQYSYEGMIPTELSGLSKGHFSSLIFARDIRNFMNIVSSVKIKLEKNNNLY